MQKIKHMMAILFMVCMISAGGMISYAAGSENQGYYLLYMYDHHTGENIEIGVNQIITDQVSDGITLDNLILFPIEGGVYHPFQIEELDIENVNREIREYLLYSGYARIDDEEIAEDYELEAQQHAVDNSLGGWRETSKGHAKIILKDSSASIHGKEKLKEKGQGFLAEFLYSVSSFIWKMPNYAKAASGIVVLLIIIFSIKKERKS